MPIRRHAGFHFVDISFDYDIFAIDAIIIFATPFSPPPDFLSADAIISIESPCRLPLPPVTRRHDTRCRAFCRLLPLLLTPLRR
jgi:hypothetical protein